MPTTTNFGWNTPADTDLVKDGALAIRTLGNNIDASLVDLNGGTTGQVLAKQSNSNLDFQWVAAGDITAVNVSSPITGGGSSGDVTISIQDGTTAQKGAVQLTDSVTSTSTTTAATPNSVKTVNDKIPDNFTLLNAGGTALTGAATITVSGISGKRSLYIVVDGASSANASSEIRLRMNTDTGNNYSHVSLYNLVGTGVDSTASFGIGYYFIGQMSTSASSNVTATLLVSGADSAGRKPIASVSRASGTGSIAAATQGDYSGSSAISSISIVSSTGNFDAGTVFVYGA